MIKSRSATHSARCSACSGSQSRRTSRPIASFERLGNREVAASWLTCGCPARTVSNSSVNLVAASYLCQSCGGLVAAKGRHAGQEFVALELFPPAKAAHEDLPQKSA